MKIDESRVDHNENPFDSQILEVEADFTSAAASEPYVRGGKLKRRIVSHERDAFSTMFR